eukprot:scaffold75241_cov44-Phaeocystis_antarctica.AAC.2
MPTPNLTRLKAALIRDGTARCRERIVEFERGTLDPMPGCTAEQVTLTLTLAPTLPSPLILILTLTLTLTLTRTTHLRYLLHSLYLLDARVPHQRRALQHPRRRRRGVQARAPLPQP